MWKKKGVFWLMKDELGGKIIREFIRFKQKMYSYLKVGDYIEKKVEGEKSK